MIFTELDRTTREWMLRRFEAEESGGNPYRSEVLSQFGLAHWPDIMRQAITDPDGSEVTLAVALNRPDYWQATETYVRNGIDRQRSVNPAQASERLAITEFNTWYVAGLAARLSGSAAAMRALRADPQDRQAGDGIRSRPVLQLLQGRSCGLLGLREFQAMPADFLGKPDLPHLPGPPSPAVFPVRTRPPGPGGMARRPQHRPLGPGRRAARLGAG